MNAIIRADISLDKNKVTLAWGRDMDKSQNYESIGNNHKNTLIVHNLEDYRVTCRMVGVLPTPSAFDLDIHSPIDHTSRFLVWLSAFEDSEK